MTDGGGADATEENLQSRARGTLLMGISNKYGPMVITTGNKSEVSVGYATLYGDMNGGFNPVKDLYKGAGLCAGALSQRDTAEGLSRAGRRRDPGEHPDQGADGGAQAQPARSGHAAALRRARRHLQLPGRDGDAAAEIVARGHEAETVKKVERMLYLAEYKRRQAAPGVKITAKNFGRDRRYPITNKFREKL